MHIIFVLTSSLAKQAINSLRNITSTLTKQRIALLGEIKTNTLDISFSSLLVFLVYDKDEELSDTLLYNTSEEAIIIQVKVPLIREI